MNSPDDFIDNDEITILKGNTNELVLFENKIDGDAFLELLKLNGQLNNRTLVSLNSNDNVKNFLIQYKDFTGKLFLCLHGSQEGSEATSKILSEFRDKKVKDVRALYNISENGNQSLKGYLQNKLNLQNKNINLISQNNSQNGSNAIEPRRISDPQHLGAGIPELNTSELSPKIQSRQNRNLGSGETLGGDDAGNGLRRTQRRDLGNRYEARGSNGNPQREDDHKNERKENSVDRILSRGIVSDRTEGGRPISDVERLVKQYKGQKLSNDQVAEVVSAACTVSHDLKIVLRENLRITDDLQDICRQFQSGGTSKEGRGILDEYYTQSEIVNAVSNLIRGHFKTQNKISVLEPSVGTGNFLYATKDLDIKSKITAFEINETTAKIAKILHPDADINLRSFETEFIDDKGNKNNSRDFSDKYDLVIGNPPYGEHRGLYKGLGEEPKISKYEDYFVKRSLDSLKPQGILAMVLPSGWLNRQKNLQNADLLEAFRLPTGAYAGTQIGTDIIILRKNNQNISIDLSTYFENNPTKILGEIREKTNRFGRLENYVQGTLDEALSKIEQLRSTKERERIGNLFEDLFLDEPEINSKNKISTKTDISLEKGVSERPASQNINNTSVVTVQDKINELILKLNSIKFKSPAIVKEIGKYLKLQSEIISDPQKFNEKSIDEIYEKAEKILQSQNGNNAGYKFQSKPDIKKGF